MNVQSSAPMNDLDPIDRARALLDDDGQPISLRTLANRVGLSSSHLQRRFRQRFGVSPAEYMRACRFAELKSALRKGSNVTDALYAAGFGSPSRVYENSDRLLGMAPARYRNGGADIAIRYTTSATPLGRVLIAATMTGICAVTLGDDDAALIAQLRDEFPKATVTRIDAGRDEWLAVVLDHVACNLTHSTDSSKPLPPVDITATAFQWRVWQALTRIPAGETRSYADIARAIGKPDAARAVGRACGANKLAFIVPCHRVVRADGKLGGWRWGVARKQDLLKREASVQNAKTTAR